MASLILILLGATSALASTFPSGLTETNVRQITQQIGGASAIRALRSAEAYDSWPGIKLGVELTLSPLAQIAHLGNGNGLMDGINIVPRITVAKGVLLGIEISACWFPANVINTVSTLGGMAKWNFYNEGEGELSMAAYFGYTEVNAFERQFLGRNVEWGAVVSKDYVRLKPYAGAGFLHAKGTVRAGNVAAAQSPDGSVGILHGFVGAEWEFPAHVTTQFDIFNFYPSFSLVVAKKF